MYQLEGDNWEDFDIEPDKMKTSISIGIIFISILVFHLLIACISNWKAEKSRDKP